MYTTHHIAYVPKWTHYTIILLLYFLSVLFKLNEFLVLPGRIRYYDYNNNNNNIYARVALHVLYLSISDRRPVLMTRSIKK